MPGSLVRKLEQFTPLSDLEKQIAMQALVHMRHVNARQDIVVDGSRPTVINLISEGFACRYKVLGDGQRQITAFLIPGDICDLRGLLLHQMDHGVAALRPCKIAVIPHQKLFDIVEASAHRVRPMGRYDARFGDLPAMADQCWPPHGPRAHRPSDV